MTHYQDFVASKENTVERLPAKIIKVRELLSDPTLAIPQYQRPYKWTSKNINQLFSDISLHRDKSAYRLGTIVVHEDVGIKNIVDGQQRTISLLLAVLALTKRIDMIKRNDLKNQLRDLQSKMINPQFTSEISLLNIYNNYREVDRLVSRESFTESHIDFFLNKCEVVFVTLTDVSEAFQFFDSQNSRGRDLDPHDLLKAFHLREFSASDDGLKASTVAMWEKINSDNLVDLFSNYLYRIRSWSRGMSARYFSKDDVGLFKGVNIDSMVSYPFVKQLQITHNFVDNYNSMYERKIDSNKLHFPFHLDQVIINGRRFFEMIHHYEIKVRQIRDDSLTCHQFISSIDSGGYAVKIMSTLNSYKARNRVGDRYVRLMFDCLLIFYIDKFDNAELAHAVEKIFIWAYTLRLRMQVVQLASMDNYVLENNLFRILQEATVPADFTNISLPSVEKLNSTQTEEIEKLFKEMTYHE